MIEEKWIKQQIVSAIIYRKISTPPSELTKVVTESVMIAIRQCRDEDPEPYRALIEKHVQRRIQEVL
jgi:hypothetical protein